ncbi:hypothetical protein U9R90_26370 [Streptomyces sp. E11-3]|uniref:hypothetical protein n=1 Tax=Streptomyces sp. E11-3 TaxID=3110112 RepID=UPI00397FAF04
MALFKKRTVGKPGEWYFCLRHGTVEEGPECRALDRFGPYTTREEAGHALQTARERNLKWENDPRWHDESDNGDDSTGDTDGTGSGDAKHD